LPLILIVIIRIIIYIIIDYNKPKKTKKNGSEAQT
jgi:hypothetical protein